MTRNKLYLTLAIALAIGYSWVAWSLWFAHIETTFTPCPIKLTTGIPCPSCGSTRSLVLLLKGNFKQAILINPLGLLAAAIMIATPFWLLYDVIFTKNTLYNSYKKTEQILQIKWIAITLILLVLLNWGWNIHKGL